MYLLERSELFRLSKIPGTLFKNMLDRGFSESVRNVKINIYNYNHMYEL